MSHAIQKKMNIANTRQHWLDRIAISMAVLCGIHCLVTPVLLVALPILAISFWVDENFHLWMLLFVLPTTGLAVVSGCRRHKDAWVLAAAVAGLSILTACVVMERSGPGHASSGSKPPSGEMVLGSAAKPDGQTAAAVGCCAGHPVCSDGAGQTVAGFEWSGMPGPHALLNLLGGAFLILGHTRNFVLCRREQCSHERGDC